MSQPETLSLAEKVAFLRRPDSYAQPPIEVEVIETHMSWVFLTDTHVYKLKKPVRRDFVDFSTLELRRRNCEDELRLNRRLAPDVYLAVVPLVLTAEGRLRLGGAGEPCEWLVRMRRLAREHMLDAAIRTGTVDPARLRAVALILSGFYRRALPVPLSADAYCSRLKRDIRDNLAALDAAHFGLDGGQLAGVAAALHGYAEHSAVILTERVHAGRIIEGHGDLRPEHICLAPPPLIIDCLEFNRELRILDPADELAYLALECEYVDAAWIGEVVLARYREIAGDTPPATLIAFYKTARALLRTKLCVWHLADRAAHEHPRWLAHARRYLELAARHAAHC